MPSVTRTNLKYDIWRLLAYEDEALVGFDVPFTTTAVETTTALEDSSLTRGGAPASQYNGRQFEIMEAVTSPATGPLVGETSWVTDGGFSANVLTGGTTLSNAVQTLTDYILWPRSLSAALIDNEINNVLRHTDAPHLWVPTLATAGNFDATDIAVAGDVSAASNLGGWADIATAAMTWVAATIWGEFAMVGTTVADAAGVSSASFAVTEREQFLVSVVAETSVGSLKAQLYDVTGAAEIESVTIEEIVPTEMRFVDTVPDDCEQAQMRFTSSGASSTWKVHAPIVVQSTWGRTYNAPSWLTGRHMVREAFYVPQGYVSEVSESYSAGGERWGRAPMPQVITEGRGVVPTRLQLKGSTQGPIGLICLRPFDTLSANTGTTNCDREYLVNKVVANIKKRLGQPKDRRYRDDKEGWRQYAQAASHRARAMGYGQREMIIEANPVRAG